jgi:hypothetical protein
VARYLNKDAGGFLAEPAEKFYGEGFTYRANIIAGGYDWTASLFTDSNVAADAGTGDLWDLTAPNKRSIFYKPHENAFLLWVDFSGTPALKMTFGWHNTHTDDDWNQVDVGVRLGVTNVIASTATGIEFSGGNLVDGDHAMQYQMRHDSKTDLYYAITAVLSCTSNVVTIYLTWTQDASSYQAYTSVVDTKVSGNKKTQFTWGTDNTWTVQTDAYNIFNSAFDADCAITSTGGTLHNLIDDVTIAGDAADHRIWEVVVS